MTKLDTYLAGRKAKDFAAQIGKSQAFVSELRKGTRKPSFATMRAIHDATKGQVSYGDWCDESERAS
jgi:DNA-binding transcriptional regulator YdaS (Cro superfamily)